MKNAYVIASLLCLLLFVNACTAQDSTDTNDSPSTTPVPPVPGVSGVLRGTLTIAPLCSVEREGVPCLATQPAFDARPITIKNANGEVVETLTAKAPMGTFTATLPFGIYTVSVQGASTIENIPEQSIEIEPEAQDIYFTVDTGIR